MPVTEAIEEAMWLSITYPRYTSRQYSLRRTNMSHYKDHTLNETHKGKGCHNLGHIHHVYTLEIENKLVRIEKLLTAHLTDACRLIGVNVASNLSLINICNI